MIQRVFFLPTIWTLHNFFEVRLTLGDKLFTSLTFPTGETLILRLPEK